MYYVYKPIHVELKYLNHNYSYSHLFPVLSQTYIIFLSGYLFQNTYLSANIPMAM